MNEPFLETKNICFCRWEEDDLPTATLLWGNPQVTNYIIKNGIFTKEEIQLRLQTEIKQYQTYGVSYYPMENKLDQSFMGCCGFRKTAHFSALEFGIHLLPDYWGKGLGFEAGLSILAYGQNTLKAKKIIAGHHPYNKQSEKLLLKLGFNKIADQYYEPTGLYHCAYELS